MAADVISSVGVILFLAWWYLVVAPHILEQERIWPESV